MKGEKEGKDFDLGKRRRDVEVEIGKKLKWRIAFLGFVVLLFLVVVRVPAGHVGVMFDSLRGGVQTQEFHGGAEGWGLKIPFVQSVIKMDVRTQTVEYKADSAITPKDKNGINFRWDVVVRYRLDKMQAAEVYRTKGPDFAEKIIGTGIRAKAREIMGGYAQEDLPENRLELAAKVKEALQQRVDEEASNVVGLNPGFLVIEAVDLRNLEFNDKIEERIIQKQQRLQEDQEMVYRLQIAEKQKQIVEIEANASRNKQILEAEGEAESIRLVAEAKADGISMVNSAYQSMPKEYVLVKYAEAIKPTDKVYLGFDSLSGGQNLGVLNYNELLGLQNSRALNVTG